jgi:hypothetical protein
MIITYPAFESILFSLPCAAIVAWSFTVMRWPCSADSICSARHIPLPATPNDRPYLACSGVSALAQISVSSRALGRQLLGRNGAQYTPEALDDVLLAVGSQYQPLQGGKTIRNLNGDGPAPKPTIASHGDVAKPEIAWAWLKSL